MMDKLLNKLRRLVPRKLFNLLQPIYHFALAWIGNLYYQSPSRDIIVLAVTGTKGKSTTVELVNAILEEAGFKTALSSTIRTKIGSQSEDNLFKMTTPGRFFLQRFLRKAANSDCEYAIVEMTSQAVLQSRHRFIELDGLIFTGIHPEHIEAHGSFNNYLNSKLELARALAKSKKPKRVAISNLDDALGELFLRFDIEHNIGYHLSDWPGYKLKIPGDFNKRNALAAITYALSQDVGHPAIKKALEEFPGVPGRMESIDASSKFGFEVIVDYAHTPGSLDEVYKLFKNRYKICVLGNCGGGRDKWKRPEMARLAEQHCDKIIFTNEDPYDEDPRAIIGDMLAGMQDQTKAVVEIYRRKAIAKALNLALSPELSSSLGSANSSPVVIITGKGSDPYIMGAKGNKQEWSDKGVVEEELAKLK